MIAFLLHKNKKRIPSFSSLGNRGVFVATYPYTILWKRDLICVWLRDTKLQKESRGIKTYRRQNIDKVSWHKFSSLLNDFEIQLVYLLSSRRFCVLGKSFKTTRIIFH